MAIVWGGWTAQSSSGNRMRVGVEFTQSPATVGAGTSSVNVSCTVYLETRYTVSDSSNSLVITGNYSHNGSISVSGSGVRQIWSGTVSRSTSYSGAVSTSITVAMSGLEATPGTARVTASHSTARRPYSAPAAPSGFSTTRQSNLNQFSLSWTRNHTTGAPWDGVQVDAQYEGGNWSRVANLSGTATSTTHTATANRRVRYRVRSVGPGGNSGWVTGAYFSTVPAAPSSVSATKVGSNIQVTYTDNAAPTGVTRTFIIFDNPGGTGWVQVGTTTATSFTHSSPNASVTHQYRVQARITSGVNLTSANSAASAVVQLLAPPNAPTLLGPTGTRDRASSIPFSWRHNPVDTTGQEAYELRYRVGSGSWTTLTGTTAQSRTVAALGVSGEISWQVRTRGEHASFGAWSAVSTFRLASQPYASISYPDGGSYAYSVAAVLWGYSNADSASQSEWQIRLYRGSELVEERAGTGAGWDETLATVLENRTTYRVEVRVRASSGLWSSWDSVTFTTDFPAPVDATPIPVWDQESGSVSVSFRYDEVPVAAPNLALDGAGQPYFDWDV